MQRLSIITVSLASLAMSGCSGNLSSRTARQEIAELADARLVPDDVQVQRIVTEVGDRAIAEANVRMAFEFERAEDGEWRVVSARLGDGQWVDIEMLMAAIEAQNQAETVESLEKLAAGVATFRVRNSGALPEVPPGGYLSDVLHPLFMTELIRDDAWGQRIRYSPEDDDYQLRSSGPDGTAGTGDDIVLGPPTP